MITQLINAYSNNIPLIAISAFTFLIGYVEYVYSFILVRKNNASPFPVWMHTLYLAHDCTAAIVFFLLAKQNNWFWLFSVGSFALFIWPLFEIYNLYKAITVERKEIWGNVSQKYALIQVIIQVIAMFVIVNYIRVFMNDVVMFKWFALTNIVMAIAPGFLWRKRGSNKGTSIGLAVVILIGTINTFLPSGMWVGALPDIFDNCWFYILGCITVCYAMYNLISLLKLAKKL